MTKSLGIAILGGTGYGAGELLRLLCAHPNAEVVNVVSQSKAGEPMSGAHPHLRGFYDGAFDAALDIECLAQFEHAVIFSALPHGISATTIAEFWPQIEGNNIKVVDLSGDLRLLDPELHTSYYPSSPLLPELRQRAVYGLPELQGEQLRSASLVANPGCLAAASVLSFAPIAELEFNGAIAIDAKTGSSGSGREARAQTHHPTRHGNFTAYKALAHQHEPEIMQALGDAKQERLHCSFVAQSLPIARGIYVTTHATLTQDVPAADIISRYQEFYASAPFVRIGESPPHLQHVTGSNFCDIAVQIRGKQLIVMTAIDNLGKGMAGTAIQNANLMCGQEESTGLLQPAPRLV